MIRFDRVQQNLNYHTAMYSDFDNKCKKILRRRYERQVDIKHFIRKVNQKVKPEEIQTFVERYQSNEYQSESKRDEHLSYSEEN